MATKNTTTDTKTIAQPLHVQYRPRTWTEVVGQKAAVKTMSRMIEERRSQAYLLSGPSGCGKTTLARIAAKHWGCAPSGIVEIDAATNSGVDHVRSIQDVARYKTFGKDGGRAIIIDEAHGLSRQSWDALLKSIEEPADHVVWFICTTNAPKVPATIKTRCTPVTLKNVDDKLLADLLDDVCQAENIDLERDVEDVVISEAQGSPRQLLVNLELCREVTSRKEAQELLQKAQTSDQVLELCRFLMRPGSWTKAMAIINRIPADSHEGTRIVVTNYFGSVLKGAKSDNAAIQALAILENFKEPYNTSEGVAPLLVSVGRTLFAG